MVLVTALWVVGGCGPPPPTSTCSPGPHLVLTTTDLEVGALATVTLDGCVVDSVASTGTDALVVAVGEDVAVLERTQSDAVRLYRPGDYTVPRVEFVVAEHGNLHDIAIVGEELWFAPWEESVLRRTDLGGKALGAIDLADEADADGRPEPDKFVVHGTDVYVGLQRLDRDAGFVPRDGRIANVDVDGVRAVFPVGPNPKISAHPTDPETIVVLTGRYFEPDGALQFLDTRDGRVTTLLTEADLGFDFDGFAAIGEVGVLTGVSFVTEGPATLGCVDLVSGAWTEAASTTGWFAAVTPAGDGVAVAVRTGFSGAAVQGVWWVDPATCAVSELATGFALDPYALAYVDR